MRLVKAEVVKLLTTNTWWLFALGAFVTWMATFALNATVAHFTMGASTPEGASAEDAANLAVVGDQIYQAANLYTSGQLFGLLFVVLLGIVMVTSEFYHQTVTSTFLTTPHRTAVISAKLIVAGFAGLLFWVVTTGLNIPATMIFLQAENLPTHLGDADVLRAILLNGLAYVLWGIFGVGIGVLIRSQVAATVTAVLAYLLGTALIGVLFTLLAGWLDQDWIEKIQYGLPSVASSLMVAGRNLPNQPDYWVGAVVLIVWAVVTGTIGTLITRKRDIS
ncbi:ABC transporter permease subunit [Asanoa siamensis]|uniref:ABC transporter permease n=1 Tax=Asanoa siamensis TaxID=926357 RepID=A0ABQ4D3Y8_9ACTN|nr:ABC transporter permease subunit [Asanoa siamensis]GIF78254.1 ABC transporter permease [Asanoa siamensis]